MKKKLQIFAFLLGISTFPYFSHGAKMLHPDFPVVEGIYQMTQEWSVSLPEKFNRRIEDGNLVIWRPGLTLWITVWGNDKNESKEFRINQIRERISTKAFDIQTSKANSISRLSYRLREEKEQGVIASYYCFAFGVNGHVQMAIYLDNEKDAKSAQNICESLIENAAR